MPKVRKRLLLWAAILVPLALIGAWAARRLEADRLAANERNASATLKALFAAECDFRSNDRDRNGVQDFWTGDIAGLFSLTVEGQALHLIPRELAEADAAPLTPLVPAPVPYQGYLFRVLEKDLELKEEYRQDTGGTPPRGKVHSTSIFGFCAFPARPGKDGNFRYIITDRNTILRDPAGEGPRLHWPVDESVKNAWSGGSDLRD